MRLRSKGQEISLRNGINEAEKHANKERSWITKLVQANRERGQHVLFAKAKSSILCPLRILTGNKKRDFVALLYTRGAIWTYNIYRPNIYTLMVLIIYIKHRTLRGVARR